MKRLLRPNVLIPLIFSVALIAGLLAFSDVKAVVGLMLRFRRIYLLWFLLLMVAYEAVRAVQWHYLLSSLRIKAPLRTQVFAFAASEAAKSMPIGNYFQNYLLQQSRGANFGLTSAATTLIILTEVAVSLFVVVILGLGSRTGWIRPLIIVGTATFITLAWAYHRFHRSLRTPKWIRDHRLLRKAVDEFNQFKKGASALLHPRILAIQGLLGATYIIIAGAALYLVMLGLGITKLSLGQAFAVYCFSLAFALIFPLPVDVGAIEISAVGAFLAEGLDRNSAVSIVLVNRALSLGSAVAIALVVIVILRDEFRAALHCGPWQQPASHQKNAASRSGADALSRDTFR